MRCPVCRQENNLTAKFCQECGTRLRVVCASCGARQPASAFCLECGASLETSPGSAAYEEAPVPDKPLDTFPRVLSGPNDEEHLTHDEGEIRLVTVLFSDMSRSVETTTDLVPEEAAALVNRLLKAMVDAIFKYEGRVDRFLGDGILAVFGAPQARESDPERAVRAALEIRDAALRLGLHATAGINTGEVYAGGVGSERRQWITVMGPIVNLASRLQKAAEPGHILVGEATYRQTRRAFVFSPISLELKGIARPVHAYEVERSLSRPKKSRGIEGLRAGLVGREEELARLTAALGPVLRPPRAAGPDPIPGTGGRVVLLTGEAGIGKSRLIAEQKEAASGEWSIVTGGPELASGGEAGRKSGAVLTTQGSPTLWLEGRCFEMGTAASPAPGAGFSLFVDLFKDYFAWRTGLRTMVGGHWSVIGHAGSHPTPAERSQPRWSPDIPLEPSSPAPLSADDLRLCLMECVDRGDLAPEQVQEMFPLLGSMLSLPLGTGEEERLRGVSPEQIKHRTMRAVGDFLGALARQQPLVLVLEDLHWADSLSLELCSRLMELAAAGPLALLCISRPEPGQAIQTLATAAAQKCPECCTEIRLRELSPEASRRLVESLLTPDALPAPMLDVILEKTRGNPFYVEEVVRSLIDAGMIYRDARGWRAGEGFQPSTVPDTVQSVIISRVDRLPRELRRVLQRAAVIGRLFDPQVLERLLPSSADLPRALSELEHHGLIQPERRSAVEEYAFRHVLTQETIYEMILRRQRSGLHRQVAETLEALYPHRQEELAEELARHYSLGGAPWKAARYLLIAGQKAQRVYANQEAIRYFEGALQYLQQLPADDRDSYAVLTAREALGDVLFRTGAHREAEQQFEAALELALRKPATSPTDRHRAALVCKLADAIQWQGKWNEAIEIAEAGLARMDGDSPSPEVLNLLEVIMRSCWARNDLPLARHHAVRIKDLLPQVPYFESIYMIHYGLAYLEMQSEEYEAAESWLQTMEDVCLEHRNEDGLARCYHGRGDLWRARGDYGRAADWFAESLKWCERTGDAHLLLEGHLELAHVLILSNQDSREIEAHIERGMGIAHEMAVAGRVPSVANLCGHLGRAYLQHGDDQKAVLYFQRALEIGEHPHPQMILGHLEQLYLRLGRHDEFAAFCQHIQQNRAAETDPSSYKVR